MIEKKTAHYASKAPARNKALDELNAALANLEQYEARAETAEERLRRTELQALAELDESVAAAERERQAAEERAQTRYREQVHAAASEHGTAKSLLEKGRAEVEAARSKLLRLLPLETTCGAAEVAEAAE